MGWIGADSVKDETVAFAEEIKKNEDKTQTYSYLYVSLCKKKLKFHSCFYCCFKSMAQYIDDVDKEKQQVGSALETTKERRRSSVRIEDVQKFVTERKLSQYHTLLSIICDGHVSICVISLRHCDGCSDTDSLPIHDCLMSCKFEPQLHKFFML